MPEVEVAGAPVLRGARLNVVKPASPVRAVVTRSEICTASKKAAGFVRHVEFDLAGTELVGAFQPGQSIGVIAPGEDDRGKAHKVRLYSVCSPSQGEDGEGRLVATTVKRTIDEHWETHKLFLGVASNFLCDIGEGDEVLVTGPAGKRFVLPEDPGAHDYLFLATGTGIAPFRGMLLELLARRVDSRVTLVMGAPYRTDLLYHSELLQLAEEHPNFQYLTAISREKQDDGHDRMYVNNRLSASWDLIAPQLMDERNLVYICGLAGMELGVFQELAIRLQGSALEQYLRVEGELLRDIRGWSRKLIGRQIRATPRMLVEVYD